MHTPIAHELLKLNHDPLKLDPPTIDIDSLQIIMSFKIHFGVTGDSVDYATNFGLVIVGDQGGYISVWDTEKWQKKSELKVHTYYISDLKYYEQNSTIFTASYDKAIKITSLRPDGSLKLVKVLYQHSNQVGSMLLLTSHSKLVSGGPYMNLQVWDIHQGYRHSEVPTLQKGGVSCIILLEKFDAICVAFISGWISLFEVNNFHEIDTQHVTDGFWNITLGFDDIKGEIYGSVGYHHLKVWKLEKEMKLREIYEDKDFPGNSILSFAPCEIDGRQVNLTTSTLSKLRYFDSETKKLEETNIRYFYFRFKVLKDKKIIILSTVQHCKIDVFKYSSEPIKPSNSDDSEPDFFFTGMDHS